MFPHLCKDCEACTATIAKPVDGVWYCDKGAISIEEAKERERNRWKKPEARGKPQRKPVYDSMLAKSSRTRGERRCPVSEVCTFISGTATNTSPPNSLRKIYL